MGIASQKDSAFIACVQDLRWIRESCRRGCLSSCVEHLLQWKRCWCRPHVTLWGPKLVFTVVSLCGPWTQSNSLSFYVARRALYFAQLQDMWISCRLSSKAAGTDHVYSVVLQRLNFTLAEKCFCKHAMWQFIYGSSTLASYSYGQSSSFRWSRNFDSIMSSLHGGTRMLPVLGTHFYFFWKEYNPTTSRLNLKYVSWRPRTNFSMHSSSNLLGGVTQWNFFGLSQILWPLHSLRISCRGVTDWYHKGV